MDIFEWIIVAIAAAAALYAGARVIGWGFGRGYFEQRANFSRRLLDDIEKRSSKHGPE